MKSILPLVIILLFLFVLAYVMILITSPNEMPGQQEFSSPFLCTDSETRSCTAGTCEGTSTCIKGVWSGCKWEQICTPGIRVPCVNQGCAYALQECDECGTGWGKCLAMTE